MRHKFLVLTVKKWLKSVYIYGSYRKIKTGVPLFLDHSVHILQKATYLTIPAKCIKWKITNISLAAPLRFVVSYAVKFARATNLFCSETAVHWPHFCRWQLRPMFI